jgi:exonuclease III
MGSRNPEYVLTHWPNHEIGRSAQMISQSRLTVATWNMNHWQRTVEARAAAWTYLRDVLAPDVALVPEAFPPADLTDVVYGPLPSVHGQWGTAVVAFNKALRVTPIQRRTVSPYLPGDLEGSESGASAAAVIALPNGREFVALSIYGAIEKAGNGTGYATTTVHRILSDLTPLLDSARERRPVVLGGDLNCSTQMEGPDRSAHEVVFARLAAFGLTDLFALTADQRPRLAGCWCARAGECAHQRTLRHCNKEASRPWQIDYLFTHHFADAGAQITVVDNSAAWALSDHAPVILTIALADS